MKIEKNTTTPEKPQVIQFHVELRDYFAAHAISAAMTRQISNNDEKDSFEIAESAYRIADAMIAARNAQPEGKP